MPSECTGEENLLDTIECQEMHYLISSFHFFCFISTATITAIFSNFVVIFYLSDWCIIVFIKQSNLGQKNHHNSCNP